MERTLDEEGTVHRIAEADLWIPLFRPKPEPWLDLALVVAGSANAVNLTDGLDGLAIGSVGIASGTFAILCYAAGNVLIAEYLSIPYIRGAGELTVLCGSLVGASANLIVAGFAERAGHRIEFLKFMVLAFPLMLVSIVIASFYVYWRYL